MKGPEMVAALAAGAALGAVINGGYILLSVSLGVLAAAGYAAMRRDRGLWPLLLVLFLVGWCRGLQWKILGSGEGLQGLAFVERAHAALCRAIDGAGFDDLAAPLVKALISGDRSGIDPEIRSAFRISGASHLLALSGMHLGLIYAVITKALGISGGHPVAVRVRSSLTILLCAFYAIVTGATPSIMRAFLFILLRETARMTGRSADPLTVFSSALMIHIILSPGSVLMPGFQLSYLAMCGVYFVFPWFSAIYPKQSAPAKRSRIVFFYELQRLYLKYDPFRKLWDVATLSISCQLFTAPVAWFHFRSFPQWFLLTNMIAMPVVTLLMLSAITTIVLSTIGIHPEILIHTTNFLASALTSALRIISDM